MPSRKQCMKKTVLLNCVSVEDLLVICSNKYVINWVNVANKKEYVHLENYFTFFSVESI